MHIKEAGDSVIVGDKIIERWNAEIGTSCSIAVRWSNLLNRSKPRRNEMHRPLLDIDGENKAVHWFLACYGGGSKQTIGLMKMHLEMSGFDGCWPEWCNTEHPSEHLTKSGAQLWLRHLFALEKTVA